MRTRAGGEAEAGRHLIAVDVQPLRRHVDVDSTLSVGHRKARLRAEEGLVLDADLVAAAHDDLTGRIRIAVPDHDGAHDVGARVVAVAVPHRRAVGVQWPHLGRARHVVHGGQGLVLDGDRLHCRGGRARATAQPRSRRARRGSARGRSRGRADLRTRGRRSCCPGTSVCVSTACTPGSASAAEMSMERIRACACGLRSVAPCSIPGTLRSLE